MSALFQQISQPANVERFHSLQATVKERGLRLTAKNTSRTRGVPCFLFYVSEHPTAGLMHFSDLDDVAAVLAADDVAPAYAAYRERVRAEMEAWA